MRETIELFNYVVFLDEASSLFPNFKKNMSIDILKKFALSLLILLILYPIKSWSEEHYPVSEVNTKESSDNISSIVPGDEKISSGNTASVNNTSQPRQDINEAQSGTFNLVYAEFKRQSHFLLGKLRTPEGFGIFLLLAIGVFLLVPTIFAYLVISAKAYKDYQLCRGTQHLKQIRSALKVLGQGIKNLSNKKSEVEIAIKEGVKQKEIDLNKALATYLVKTQLDSVEGIGQKLKLTIIRGCFDGTLKSLHYAQGRVYGVGSLKQSVMSSWVRKLESEFSKLLENDFPDKTKIVQVYEEQDKKLRKQLEIVTKELVSLVELQGIAVSNEERLSKTRPYHFVKAYENNKNASEQVSEYIKGAFPEWAAVPGWFKTLISEYGHENARMA